MAGIKPTPSKSNDWKLLSPCQSNTHLYVCAQGCTHMHARTQCHTPQTSHSDAYVHRHARTRRTRTHTRTYTHTHARAHTHSHSHARTHTHTQVGLLGRTLWSGACRHCRRPGKTHTVDGRCRGGGGAVRGAGDGGCGATPGGVGDGDEDIQVHVRVCVCVCQCFCCCCFCRCCCMYERAHMHTLCPGVLLFIYGRECWRDRPRSGLPAVCCVHTIP